MDLSVADMTNGIRRVAGDVDLGGSLRINLGDEGNIFVKASEVLCSDQEADCTISCDLETFRRLYSGSLDPSYAYMQGNLRILGSESIAFRLPALFDSANDGNTRIPRFTVDADMAHVVDALRSTGAVVVEDVIDDELTGRVVSDLQPHFDAVGASDQSDFNGFRTHRLYSILARSRSAAEIIAHEKLVQVADAILLPHCVNYRIGSCTAIEILPGEKQQRLHRDDAIYPMELPGVELQISAMWPLTDFTEENGATHVLPGSHKNSIRIAAARSDQSVQAPMRKGSVLFYLGSTYHGGGANQTDTPRIGLINTYALGWLRQEENHYLGIPRDVADSYPKKVRELMGYQSHGPILGAFGDVFPG